MGIETKYEYTYYTVINTSDWRHGNEEWFADGFTWDAAINFIEHKFKTSQDKGLNNFRVEYAQYCDDIEFWRHRHIQHKEMPVFVQFQQDQEIKSKGAGDLLIIYEDDGVHYSGAEGYYNDEVENNYGSSDCPDGPYYGTTDGLAGAGGRL